MLISIWPTYDLSVRTEVGRKSTTKCISLFQTILGRKIIRKIFTYTDFTMFPLTHFNQLN
jgi:hypothetical protein